MKKKEDATASSFIGRLFDRDFDSAGLGFAEACVIGVGEGNRAYEILFGIVGEAAVRAEGNSTVLGALYGCHNVVDLFCGDRADALATDFAYRNTAFRLTNAARDASKLDIPTIRK